MSITTRYSWLPEMLVFIAFSGLYLMADKLLSQLNRDNLAIVLIGVLSLLASFYWLRQAHRTRNEAHFGNILLIYCLILGGTFGILSNLISGGFYFPWPISAASIIYGVFLLKTLPKTLVLG
jgi:FtsH-binding integral membrane protein